ncbi:NADH-quinone oxidoreductase subunit C [Streptomyces sp. CB03234]|uniref:NADH-quinone oxidoreductase subunit C n=1 Tax=Streptomyces sp. (strain CB03234) TaxID=1703937 RepID=UPI000939EB63|nr:NADH-quinone oxidoreductase subunit C [Streptomyces sp. CB03234]
MTAYDRLPESVTEIFGEGATAEQAYELLTVDVPVASWIAALETARDELGCTYFDWLSAVDEPGTGFRVCAHVVALGGGRVRRLLLRTTVPHDAPALPSAIGVYAGAGWHERETYEMFGIRFEDHPNLVHLLLPENFEGNPLRKDFVLAARVAKAWPGAKEPGESEHGGPKRRQMLPPGVPDPNDWGPLKGQLPPAPARPARAARPAGDRPVRRTRTAGEGSASQAAPEPAVTEAAATEAAPPRRTRSASEGSASQPAAPAGPRRTRSASAGSASQRGTEPATETSPTPPPRTRSTDAPWNNPRPAFDDTSAPAPETATPPSPEPQAVPEPEAAPEPDTLPTPASPKAAPEPEAAPGAGPEVVPEPEAAPGAGPAAVPGPEAAPETDDTAPAPETRRTNNEGDA